MVEIILRPHVVLRSLPLSFQGPRKDPAPTLVAPLSRASIRRTVVEDAPPERLYGAGAGEATTGSDLIVLTGDKDQTCSVGVVVGWHFPTLRRS
jgi:hypothetical protein